MKAIDLSEKNWVWFFYCKHYTIVEDDIPSPKNLCSFWWTAVDGFLMWVGKEAKLWHLWLVAALLTAIVFTIGHLFPNTESNFALALVFPVVSLWLISFMVSLIVPAVRLYNFVEKKAPWLIYGPVSILIIFTSISVVSDGEMMSEIFKIFGYFFLGVVSLIVVIVVGMFLFSIGAEKLPYRFVDGAENTFSTTVSFVKARKQKVCPLVNAPKSFTPKEQE